MTVTIKNDKISNFKIDIFDTKSSMCVDSYIACLKYIICTNFLDYCIVSYCVLIQDKISMFSFKNINARHLSLNWSL